jgi:hypothetical protein
MTKITYVHTSQRETISILEALEKAVMSEKMKLILKVRTQVQEVQLLVNTQVCEQFTIVHRVYLNFKTSPDEEDDIEMTISSTG